MVVAALYWGCCHLAMAQMKLGVWYDTELQTDFKGGWNYVNMLYLSSDLQLNEHLTFSAASISIVKTREESLLGDLQTFSNIEADNQPFTLALACLGWKPNDKHSLYFGVRNINEDYFTSPVTSLFINSSCGIFPTVGCNMDIANYPVASVGLHYSYAAPTFCLQASAYNGQAYDRLAGADNLWRITPRSDGLFFITQAEWQRGKGHYYAGVAQHTGVSGGASAQTALWAYTEQSLTEKLSLIADCSHAFGRSSQCTDFAAVGGQYAWSKSTLGLFTDYARFRNDSEWATELTYQYNLTSILFMQASFQFIHHGSWQPVGLIRMSVRI